MSRLSKKDKEDLEYLEVKKHIRDCVDTAGYNNIRFDDEFSRFGFYRNFIETGFYRVNVLSFNPLLELFT